MASNLAYAETYVLSLLVSHSKYAAWCNFWSSLHLNDHSNSNIHPSPLVKIPVEEEDVILTSMDRGIE